ncbi:carbonyl reductase [NADPH] 1-like [Limulus polyphemus]|uniref:carbonyl reductase (NADPH) n=1 Tax=Limulus polyphemus TaxID=6850 RepID=A0ABM1BUW7_LIMPO|nr:carbonyl reductase [NADPH] 1-like [Limulus polyphemus]XP_013789141.1 carbonyl reductase [NADPH] 1-like [Limulus polyphemus]XP_013789142.1 carbonyl reductase [NADPH] 1-like [Limulus polyphemus]XP_022257227.1 carbonyl reductase [NADPH] 1-like [Limulus polyphemus]XP_022257228.1 carbonyl reductase [NADPH] 1-like [Limulus polyphemus]XP_022257229.1 carbonyl reductase [NADPH] 1-like [Limulus polyphemus]XP_022257230.1 carbonyl reductase [NADPH] 1-like [Limulus polyphemus]
MARKVAVVTGGNKGIGYAVVKELCQKFNGDVILAARDEARGKDAVEQLKALNLNPVYHQLDIDDTSSISQLKDFLHKEYGGLDILVNNAAIAYKMASTTPDAEQAENSINTNFFGTLNVCKALFPILRPHARVVNVSSSAGRLSNIPNKELQKKFLVSNLTEEELCGLMKEFVSDAKAGLKREKGWAHTNYMMSKIGVSALTFLQQREFDKDSREDLVVNAVHPGYVNTDMTSGKGVRTIEEGAEPIVYAALLPPNIKSPKGEYIWEDSKVVSWV